MAYQPPSIVGEHHPLTDKQRRLLALAEQVGRESLAPRAARWDREASFPFENYDDIRAGDTIEAFRVEHVSRTL